MITSNLTGTAMSRYTQLANSEFSGGFASDGSAEVLRDELVFQRAVQAYLWSIPAINIWAMKEGSDQIPRIARRAGLVLGK